MVIEILFGLSITFYPKYFGNGKGLFWQGDIQNGKSLTVQTVLIFTIVLRFEKRYSLQFTTSGHLIYAKNLHFNAGAKNGETF